MTPELMKALSQGILAQMNGEPPPAPLSPLDAQREGYAAPARNSPVSNDVEKAVEPQVVSAQMAADQARRDSAKTFQGGELPVPDAPIDTSVRGPNGEPINADALMADNVSTRNAAINANAAVGRAQADAAKQNAAVDANIALAQKPAEDELQNRIQEGYEDLHKAKEQVEVESQAAIANYSQTQEQMRKLAMEKPQDLFGQSGVNRIMGSIAIMIGGAGTNGNHENHALAFINSLADRNIAAQKQQFLNLQAVGQGDQTLYGMLQNKLKNQEATEATLRNMAITAYESKLKQAANQYAGPKVKALLATQLAKTGEETNKNNQIASEAYLRNGEHILMIRSQENASKVAERAAALKQNQYIQENQIAGVIGYVPKGAHERISKMVGGARTMVAMTNHIEDMIRAGADLSAIREYMVANAVQFKGARDFLETGTRIEAGEQRIIDQLNPASQESLFSAASEKLFGSDPTKLLAKLDAIRATVTETAWTEIQTTAPNTTAFDAKDPLWGRYDPHSYKSAADRLLADKYGDVRGRQTIDALPAYNDAEQKTSFMPPATGFSSFPSAGS